MTVGRGRAAGSAAAAAAAAAALTVLAACAAPPAGVSASPAPGVPAAAALPLAQSLVDAGGTSWAVIEMGGRSAQEENFWQVFVRPAAAGGWRLATPAGVADNGGLVVASTGAGDLLAGFRPSQDLTFSPLAATADGGLRWTPGGPVSPGLSDVPGALAAGPGDQLIALTGGGAELSQGAGRPWTRLASTRGLAATAAGRACGLTSVTAAGFTAGGGPLLGGTCSQPGVAGIFARHGGAWQLAGPHLPPGLAGAPVQVLRLGSARGASVAAATRGRAGAGNEAGAGNAAGAGTVADTGGVAGTGSMALLAVGRGAAAGVVAAWSGDGGRQWRLSPVLRTERRRVRSASLWPDGSAGLVLSGPRGRSGAVIGGPDAAWTALPALPAGTATLARGAGVAIEALTVARARMGAWRLSAAVAGWTQFQQVRVSIPYGSSG